MLSGKKLKVYGTLFPIPELRNYMWDHLASTLGINHDKHLIFIQVAVVMVKVFW